MHILLWYLCSPHFLFCFFAYCAYCIHGGCNLHTLSIKFLWLILIREFLLNKVENLEAVLELSQEKWSSIIKLLCSFFILLSWNPKKRCLCLRVTTSHIAHMMLKCFKTHFGVSIKVFTKYEISTLYIKLINSFIWSIYIRCLQCGKNSSEDWRLPNEQDNITSLTDLYFRMR